MAERAHKLLLARITEPRVLEAAWRSVRFGTSLDSEGSDGIRLRDFARNASRELRQLREDLRSGAYAFGGYRGVPILKKRDGSLTDPKNRRPISIASIRDRIVQRAVLEVIWYSIRDKVCTESSYGGIGRYYRRRRRPDAEAGNAARNVRSAAEEIIRLRRGGFGWVFETDIESFFPSIDKRRLLDALFCLLPDDTLNPLIERFLDTSIVNASRLPAKLAELWDPEGGVPQGGTLSPVLANLYLHDFDSEMESVGFKMVRYVDDLVVLAKSEQTATAAYGICRRVLTDLGLRIHPLGNNGSKTNILRPNQPFDFLGLTFNIDSLRPSQKKLHKLRERIMELTDAAGNRGVTLVDLVKRVNGLLTGWIKAYSFCNISKRELREIDDLVTRRVRRWMELATILRKGQPLKDRARDALGVMRAERVFIRPIMQRTQTDCGSFARGPRRNSSGPCPGIRSERLPLQSRAFVVPPIIPASEDPLTGGP